MKEFGTTIASVMHRPHWFSVPNFILKTALGEMSMLVIKGQKALPETLIQHRYPFLFSNLKSALEDIFK
jgi:NAD dependent epimerase/dehydratase family enzyme